MALLWPKGVPTLHVELSHVLESGLWPNVPVYGFTVQADMVAERTRWSPRCYWPKYWLYSDMAYHTLNKEIFHPHPITWSCGESFNIFYSVHQIGLCNAIDLNNGLQIPKYWIIIPLEAWKLNVCHFYGSSPTLTQGLSTHSITRVSLTPGLLVTGLQLKNSCLRTGVCNY